MADTEQKEPTTPLSCLLPAKLSRRVMAYAKSYGISRTSAVIMLLNQGLENEGQTAVPLTGHHADKAFGD
jgi:hypothetical protein